MWCRTGLLAAVTVVGACASDDEDWMVRPPGGGTGGTGEGGDARMIDAGGDAAGGQVTGLVCVIADLRQPDACPDTPLRAGVVVRVEGSQVTATSAIDGRFTIPAQGAQVGLDLADNVATLQRSRVRAAVSGALVHAPVPTRAHYDAVIASLGSTPTDGTGAIVLYVDDASGPVPGVVFDAVAGAGIPPFYDGSGPLTWREQGGTGAAGVVLMVDVPTGILTVTGTAADQRILTLSGISVEADRVTFVRGRLP